MGTPNPSVQKRAKEQKRKEKAEEKRCIRDAKRKVRLESASVPVEDVSLGAVKETSDLE